MQHPEHVPHVGFCQIWISRGSPKSQNAICGGGLGAFLSVRPEESFRDAASWTDKTYRDRRDDISKLVEALRHDSRWSNQIDWPRVALAGHSLGGYTVLGLAGGWLSWRLPNIKAVLALFAKTSSPAIFFEFMALAISPGAIFKARRTI
jgi:pimeloyl-ACP methyl ester carboxylesterase